MPHTIGTLSRCLMSVVLTWFTTQHASAQSAADKAIIDRLQATVVDAEYLAVDLEKVIEDLRKTHDLNIQISWKLLEMEGIRRDHRLEVRLKGVSLATLLDNILREADPAGAAALGWQVEGGVLVITTREAISRSTYLGIYDITDFLESGYADRRFFSTPLLSLAVTGQEALGGENVRSIEDERAPRGRAGGGGIGGGMAGGGSSGGNPFEENSSYLVSDMELADALIEIIVEAVTPEDWEQSGGLTATVRYHDNRLLVRHTIDGHIRLQAFLELLRTTRPAPLDADVVVVRVRGDKVASWHAGMGDLFPRVPGDAFTRLVSDTADEDVLFRGTTSGFNGRRLWFSALTQRDLIAAISASSAGGGSPPAFSPEKALITDGLELIALPMLAPDGTTLRVDIQMAWMPTPEVTPREVRLSTGEGGSTIDLLSRHLRTVSATVEMRAGEAIVLSIPRQLSDAGAAPEWEEFLVLRLRPRVEPKAPDSNDR